MRVRSPGTTLRVTTTGLPSTSSSTRVVIWAIAAVSLNMILGYGGLVSFGHAAFFGIGAYVVAMLSNHADWGTPFLGVIPGTNSLILCLLAAMICAGLAALAERAWVDEALGELTGLNPGELATLLVGLELAGAVRQLPGNRYMKL